jgi:hypothetical protein
MQHGKSPQPVKKENIRMNVTPGFEAKIRCINYMCAKIKLHM